jgi:transposase InsO family protein
MSVAAAARDFAVSRKTAHKWLAVFDAAGGAPACPSAGLTDRSRRPRASPARTPDAATAALLDARDRFGWGGRKCRAFVLQDAARRGQPPPDGLPAARTCDAVLARHGRVPPRGPAADAVAPGRFERAAPNDLWQVDHKGGVEVDRRRRFCLTVIDDHSRYLLAFEPLDDKTMARAFDVLWGAFERAGLPAQVLSDNAFNAMGTDRPAGLSWFDARLVRLGIEPAHGGPYHPQTQGKAERLHATADAELVFRDARRDTAEHFAADCRAWRDRYNALRPHQAIGDVPPAARWRPAADRPRPAALPDPESHYPPGGELRRVCREGLLRLDGCRVLVGRGIAGQAVRVERRDHGEVAVFYCRRELRRLAHDQMIKDRVI